MKKRVLAMVLAVVMVCALLPTAALAAAGDFTIESGVLTKYNGPGGVVVIPRTVDRIGELAFASGYSPTSVFIPDTVSAIEYGAFAYCTGLTSVTIPDSVTTIGGSAFWGCDSLTSVTILDGVTSIGAEAFEYCSSLTSVTIPDSVTSIGRYAFDGCKNLTSVTIGKGMTSIGESAFVGCGLTSVTIPDSVTSIGQWAFDNCTKLTSVTIPDSVTSIAWEAFSGCVSLTDVYYGGSKAQWDAFDIGDDNWHLQSANIHFNSAMPALPAANIAHPSTQTVDVDGKAIEFQCYALKDANGNDTNYIKLRDLADILNGSAAQFQVGWDGNITITTKTAYTKNGSEQNTPFSGQRAYEKTAVKTLVDGVEAALDTFQLKDDAGGGYTYYKLRDLGKALGITVDWSAERGIYIETK